MAIMKARIFQRGPDGGEVQPPHKNADIRRVANRFFIDRRNPGGDRIAPPATAY
jgi:hypothetical protein